MSSEIDTPELKDEMARLYRCIFYDMSDGVYREDMFVREAELIFNRHYKSQTEQVLREVIGEKYKEDTYSDGSKKFFRKDSGSGGNWRDYEKAMFGNALIEMQYHIAANLGYQLQPKEDS